MQRWSRNLYVLWGAVFLLMAAMSSIIPFLPLLIEQNMGIESEKEVAMWSGLIFGANFFTAFLVSPFWGIVADRYGRKIMILRSGFGMAIVIIMMGLATNVYQLLILRLVNGLIAGFNPAAIALIATNTPKEKVGYALGVLNSGRVAGTIIGPFFGGLLADYIGFSQIFLYTGLLIMLSAFLVLLLVQEDFKPIASSQSGSFIQDFNIILRTQPLSSLFMVSFLIQFAVLNVNPILPLYIGKLNPPGDRVAFFAGLVSATTGFANMAFSPKLGKLGDKYGSEKVLFYSLIGAALFFLPQGFSGNVWQLMMWRFLLGLTIGGLLPSIDSLIRHYSPVGMESRTYSYSSSALFLGNLLGPIVGGILAGIIGFKGMFLFTGILLLTNGIIVKRLLQKQIQIRKFQSM
ncbi:multidrug transporter [Vulcanibacillus modesticaldus]|uniref:Multidrug transporter n=1 Tax=Vulcanibacillus modesticaldus TaxID=337097 RepID=A0A1D2YT97_9BACI|nr:MFS transporter [Vulcanibacillus modesticaldus]OEF98897.1 multidrug transporter [Vulcanibacillus modesticaldus]